MRTETKLAIGITVAIGAAWMAVAAGPPAERTPAAVAYGNACPLPGDNAAVDQIRAEIVTQVGLMKDQAQVVWELSLGLRHVLGIQYPDCLYCCDDVESAVLAPINAFMAEVREQCELEEDPMCTSPQEVAGWENPYKADHHCCYGDGPEGVECCEHTNGCPPNTVAGPCPCPQDPQGVTPLGGW